jgi:CHAT domain-containing protein
MLVAPIRRKIAHANKLVIIPDEVLHHLPFEALLARPIQGTTPDFAKLPYLIHEFEVRYHASAAMLSSDDRRPAPERSGTGFAGLAPVFSGRDGISGRTTPPTTPGNERYAVTTRAIQLGGRTFPALLASADEVRGIARLFEDQRQPVVTYLHDKATESALKDPSTRQSAYVHIASHGFINENRPKLSGLILAKGNAADDGVLYSGEVYNLETAADLVVLSACESGLGKVVRGEGILGLTRGFLYAGARNIVVSLWQVADRSTAEMMLEFYRNILEGQTYSSALRTAKLKMIKGGKYAYPLEWSPFVLNGQ